MGIVGWICLVFSCIWIPYVIISEAAALNEYNHWFYKLLKKMKR